MSFKLQGKTWEELFIHQYEKSIKQTVEIKKLCDKLQNLDFDGHDVRQYYEAYKKNIHIPKWTLLKDATPNDFEPGVVKYLIFSEPDFIHLASWHKDHFIYFIDDERFTDFEVAFWMPIIYPSVY